MQRRGLAIKGLHVAGRVGEDFYTIGLDEEDLRCVYGGGGQKWITKGGIIWKYLQKLYFFLAD